MWAPVPSDDGDGGGAVDDAASRARLRADQYFSLLGLAMWGGTAVKCYPFFTPAQLAQCLAGWLAMLLISLAWPAAAPGHYLRHRTLALAFLQIFLFALPFNFDTAVFDAIAPGPAARRAAAASSSGGGRVGGSAATAAAAGAATSAAVPAAANATASVVPVTAAVVADALFQVFMAVRVALLVFTSVGWPLRLRQQMAVQACKVAMLARFGTGPYCASKLLTSPEMGAVFSLVHRGFALLGTPLMPLTPPSAIIPQSPHEQRVAILLLSWLLLGWLLPCLLLLPERRGERAAPATSAPSRRPSRVAAAAAAAASKVGDSLESGLRLLLPAPPPSAPGGAGAEAPAALPLVLRWWALLGASWAACCCAARLFN